MARGTIPVLILLFLSSTFFENFVVGKQKFCGSALNEVLDLVCAKGYRRKLLNEGDESLDYYYGDYETNYQTESPLNAVFKDCKWRPLFGGRPCTPEELKEQRKQLPKEQSSSSIHRLRRSLGIVRECCYSGCSYADIYHYCMW